MNGSVGYLIKKGVSNIWLYRFMSLASMGILTACLIILGGAAVLALNLQGVFRELENQNEIYVFLQDDLTEEQTASVASRIEAIDHVASIRFVPPEEGLDIMKNYLGGNDAYLLEGLEADNPLPPAFHVTLDSLDNVDIVYREIQKVPYIDTISAPTQLAEVLSGVKQTAILLGGVIIGILLIASIVVINNTIRLTVYARRKEINIMKYVGATNGFIRLPFIVEGITLGALAALAAFVIILIVYQSLADLMNNVSVAWLSVAYDSIIPFSQLWYWILGGFMASGVVIGSMGSSAAIRRHLRV